MKLRLVKKSKNMLLYCLNGSVMNATNEVLARLLTSFDKPTSFKGGDGYWDALITNMEDAEGITLAYVDDSKKLIILDTKVFVPVISEPVKNKFISASEYAAKHEKSRASVKNMCAAGRIEGAYKTSSGWLIPENAPYPVRNSVNK